MNEVEGVGVGLGVEDAVNFKQDFGSIQLKTLMQRLAVCPYVELL